MGSRLEDEDDFDLEELEDRLDLLNEVFTELSQGKDLVSFFKIVLSFSYIPLATHNLFAVKREAASDE